MDEQTVAKQGGFRYENGSTYVGSWNSDGRPHHKGELVLTNGTRYRGYFENGLFNGKGVLIFPDGAKYEGEFLNGWIHGHGVFWRADGMKHEGEFRGGKICGLGLTTFADGTHGFPKNEGYFQNCKLVKRVNCEEIVYVAQRIAYQARN